jgi:hypothetical protein
MVDLDVDNTLLVGNTITSGGFQGQQDCWDAPSTLTSLGYNLVETVGNCAFAAVGDQTGAGLGVGLLPLGDHGCLTQLPDGTCLPTMALAAGSPALDGGSCATSGETTDQRGVGRPQDHATAANADDACDVGAFELDPGGFHTLSPCRVIDTRLSAEGPALAHLTTREIAMHGKCGIPATAVALALNVTITEPTGGGNVTIYPGDLPTPGTSIVSFSTAQTRASSAVLPLALALDGSGTLDAVATMVAGATTHLILDVTGYLE